MTQRPRPRLLNQKPYSNFQVCEPLILGRPDVVDDLHDIKLIFRRRHVPVEMQAYNIHEVSIPSRHQQFGDMDLDQNAGMYYNAREASQPHISP